MRDDNNSSQPPRPSDLLKKPETGAGLEFVEVSGIDVLAGSLGALAQHLGGFVATNSSTPLTALLLVFVREVGLGGADKGSEFTLVLALDVLQGQYGRCLLVHDRAKTGFTLDNDVGDTHLAAEGGEEHHELDGVDVVCDDDKRGLLCFDEGDAVVQAVFNEERLLRVLGLSLLLISSGLRSYLETSLLLLLRLRSVLIQKLEQLCSSVLVEGVRELGNGGRNLETLAENDLLALQANIFGPLDEAGQISFGAHVLADTEVLGLRFEQGVFDDLGRLTRSGGSWGGLLSGSFGFGGLVIETRVSAMRIQYE